MRARAINWPGVLLPCLVVLPLSTAGAVAPSPAAEDGLLQQVRAAETSHKYDLAAQALYRLESIAPNHPEVIAAQLRRALWQGDREKARQYLARLMRDAPDSRAARQSNVALRLTTDEGRQQWQQARLLAATGRLPQARAAYDRLFQGVFPSADTAFEYWRLVARIDDRQPAALRALQALDEEYPGSERIRLQIVRMLLAREQLPQALPYLRALANGSRGREDAAAFWLNHIKAQPVSHAGVAQLRQYLALFATADEQRGGQQELARQQALLADPEFRQRAASLARVAHGEGATAIPALRAALRANPNDAELLGSLGLALSRARRREEATGYFERALKADEQSVRMAKWQSLLQSTRYWLAIERAGRALAQQDLAVAERHFRLALTLDDSHSEALVGLGDVERARRHNPQAEQNYRQALRRAPDNATALRRLVALYQQQSPQSALFFLDSGLSQGQRQALAATLSALRGVALGADADRLAAQGRRSEAIARYRQALDAAPHDVWLHYRLAGALRESAQPEQADSLMDAMLRRQPDDAARLYAWSLYLAASDRGAQALSRLNRTPEASQESRLRSLTQRLQQEEIFRRAWSLRRAGLTQQAATLVQTLPASPRRDVLLADWHLENGEAALALAGYRAVLAHTPDSLEARLGVIDALIALQREKAAKLALNALPDAAGDDRPDIGRRIAGLWRRLGDPEQASRRYAQLRDRAAQRPPSADGARIYLESAALARDEGLRAQADDDYRQAMVASGITPAPPHDSLAFSRLTRQNPQDDWLQRAVRREAGAYARQQETTLTLAQDASRQHGSGGESDFTARTTMLQGETPLADGRAFLRLDRVAVSAGAFAHDATGRYTRPFGTCADAECRRDQRQRASGVAVGTGWRNAVWSADIGSTPIGFRVLNAVGGVTRKLTLGQFDVSLSASRRPLASSLLAFAGARDPGAVDGRRWGGVVATGGAIGLSYDRGGNQGLWVDLSAHRLSGKNVADNRRQRLMAGYYYKWINDDNRRATVGINGMLWRYQQDLSGYTYGQGGYYSPQRYVSLSLPVTFRQRVDRWSFEFGGAIAWSQTRQHSQRRYPVWPGFADDHRSAGGGGHGAGYTLQAALERRLTPHWALGLGLDIQKARDYAPSHGLVYLRYSPGGWDGDPDMPPRTLTPYADFK
ncbi:cellulose biosynthesis protein BcsC [Affinibrenneria salicis]|uniref:Cellulose biosynthesis protein BcsC n=2 Tax=Affinibrenneria salicis TaxID=2590031 RepID=A0A5J5G214_9GAMM|nr:cellulose biosynthesis protein BcsC [Affinibrenneria salicis]